MASAKRKSATFPCRPMPRPKWSEYLQVEESVSSWFPQMPKHQASHRKEQHGEAKEVKLDFDSQAKNIKSVIICVIYGKINLYLWYFCSSNHLKYSSCWSTKCSQEYSFLISSTLPSVKFFLCCVQIFSMSFSISVTFSALG